MVLWLVLQESFDFLRFLYMFARKWWKTLRNIQILLRHTEGEFQKPYEFLMFLNTFELQTFKISEKPCVILPFCDPTPVAANLGYEIQAQLYFLLKPTRTLIAKAIGREF